MNLTGARNARLTRANAPPGDDDEDAPVPRKVPGEKEVDPTASNLTALFGGNFGSIFGG